MKKIESYCVGCTSMGLPCLGSTCRNRENIHYYCDRCDEEKTLYHFDGEELCIDCIEKELEVVEGSDD